MAAREKSHNRRRAPCIHRPDLKNQSDVLDDLRAEWTNMLLFASKKTLDLLRVFILDPTGHNLAQCAISMRVDLGRQPVGLESLDLNLTQGESLRPGRSRISTIRTQ
jgi:hypothetical protein